jgi:ketosteroid isomerase-like protein
VSNLDLAARFNTATERRDEAELVRLIAPDAIWDMSRSRGPYSGVYRGHEEIRRLLEGQVEAWEAVALERLSTYEVGGWLAEEVQATLQGRGSGVELAARGARVYEFRGGLIARFVMFQDMDDAKAYVDAQP